MASRSRQMIRLGLLGAGILSLLVAILPLVQLGTRKPETWATIAAALAVLTAVVSAWTSQRVLELQEDAQEPSISVSLDLRRRSELVQLRIANVGGSLAKDVQVTWDTPLLDVDGQPVRISSLPDGPDILPVLPSGQSSAILVGLVYRFFEKYKDSTYSGVVSYKNVSGDSRRQRFVVSGEIHRRSLVHEDEEALTHQELQRIPRQLKEIASEVSRLREFMESTRAETGRAETPPNLE